MKPYDPVNRLTQVAHAVRPSGLTISYPRYDAVGNREQMTDAFGTHTYTYDPLSQVRSAWNGTGFQGDR